MKVIFDGEKREYERIEFIVTFTLTFNFFLFSSIFLKAILELSFHRFGDTCKNKAHE